MISHFDFPVRGWDCLLWYFSVLTPCWPLDGFVVKASPSGAEDPGFESCLWQDFCGLSHTCDLKIKIRTPVATLSDAWGFRVSAGTGWHGVSILWLGETELDLQLLSVAARKLVRADQSLRYTCWDVKQPTNNSHFWMHEVVLGFGLGRKKKTMCRRGYVCLFAPLH